jgi:hypothetical protein
LVGKRSFNVAREFDITEDPGIDYFSVCTIGGTGDVLYISPGVSYLCKQLDRINKLKRVRLTSLHQFNDTVKNSG